MGWHVGSSWGAPGGVTRVTHRVTHILNVAREIDNFFPALFTYMNVRVYDEEAAELLPHWNDTFLFLSRVRSVGMGGGGDTTGDIRGTEGQGRGGHREGS